MELTKDCITEIHLAALKTDRLVITVQTRPENKQCFELILQYETSRRIGPGLRNDPSNRQDLPWKNRQKAPETSRA
jgi:hypothetical protein